MKMSRKILITAGACLLLGAVALLTLWQWRIGAAEQKAAAYVQTLRTLLPESQGALAEPRRDNTMSVLPVDGTDFVGILELPSCGSTLPVGNTWGESDRYPCRFAGSIYDGSLQIGATSQKGQCDFGSELFVGDTVCFTDMEGNRYTYRVSDLRYEKHADQQTLTRGNAPLVLFIKNIYAFDYLIVYCEVLN